MHLCHVHGETMGLNEKKNELVECRGHYNWSTAMILIIYILQGERIRSSNDF